MDTPSLLLVDPRTGDEYRVDRSYELAGRLAKQLGLRLGRDLGGLGDPGAPGRLPVAASPAIPAWIRWPVGLAAIIFAAGVWVGWKASRPAVSR